MELIGAAVLRVKMLELGKTTGPTILVRCKVFAEGTSDWHGLILGASALEPAPQGLGHRVTQRAHAFEALGILMPRAEDRDGKDRKDDIYKVGYRKSHAIGLEALPCPFQDVLDPEEIPPEAQASVLVYDDPEPVVLAPGEGAWLPALRPKGNWREVEGEIWPLLDASVEAVAGTWGAEDKESTVLVVNTGLQEAVLEQGDPVASLVSPAHPLHFHGSSSAAALPPQQVAHIVEDTEAFVRMLEV